MTHDNFHATPQDPDCPYCIIVALTLALERVDPHSPALTPAVVLLDKSNRERVRARQAAR